MTIAIETETVLEINTDLGWNDSRFIVPLYKVGDGVSLKMWSDINPGTIVKVAKNGKEIHVQHDKATRDRSFKPEIVPGGFSGHCVNQHDQKWIIEPDPEGPIEIHTLRTWRGIKVWTAKGGTPNGRNSVSPGRYKFYDYNL
jgi:hypothetical protein